jgi:hypothetical protein
VQDVDGNKQEYDDRFRECKEGEFQLEGKSKDDTTSTCSTCSTNGEQEKLVQGQNQHA